MILDEAGRYELKFNLEPHQLSQARSWLWLHPGGFRPTFPPRFVNSLYFDTHELDNLNDNLGGVGLRHKLRLRWYGALVDTVENPVLELKYKRNMLGWKKRFEVPVVLELAERWTLVMRALKEQVPGEWLTYLGANPQPVLIVRYRREYYGTADGLVRATLDYDQQTFEQRLTARPNRKRPLALTYQPVIELKASQGQRASLEAITAHLPVARSRNSKYVNGALAQW